MKSRQQLVFEGITVESDEFNETETIVNRMSVMIQEVFTNKETTDKQEIEEKKEMLNEIERSMENMMESLTVLHVLFDNINKRQQEGIEQKEQQRSSVAKRLIKRNEEKLKQPTHPNERIAIQKKIEELRSEIVEGSLCVDMLEHDEQQQIESWTKKKCDEVIFDSDQDDWGRNTSVFDDKVINRSNLVFVIEDTDDNKFGGYIGIKINEINRSMDDPKVFLFSLKSNGRIDGMMKFEARDTSRAVRICNKSNDWKT